MTPEELRLLISYAHYGADTKESLLERTSREGGINSEHDRESIKSVRELVAKLASQA